MVKHILATTALSLALVFPAVSQETPAPDPATGGGAAPGAVAPEPPAPLMPVDLAGISADELIGSTLINADEQTLGTVDDAVLDADGKVASLVVSFGGFLGFGAKTVELPMEQVEIKSRDEQYFAVTDLTPDALEGMPVYEQE